MTKTTAKKIAKLEESLEANEAFLRGAKRMNDARLIASYERFIAEDKADIEALKAL